MKRCVIIGGANIGNYERLRKRLNKEDFFIYCDSGLKHWEPLGFDADLITGDFDSWKDRTIVTKHRSEEEIRQFNLSNYLTENTEEQIYEYREGKKAPMILIPPEKYDSDTMFGVREGIRRGFREFLFIGVVGQRFDHSFANVCILLMLDHLGLKGTVLDDYSEMEILSSEPGFIEDCYSCFSLLNISGNAKKISIENARYTFVPNKEIPAEHQFGISNEVIPGKTAKVTVGEGNLLLVKVF